MAERDDIATVNRAHWEREVERGGGFTVPWLDLRRGEIERYIAGELDPVPDSLFIMYPASVLAGVAGKDVLCLAAGGGQQTAVFGLLGARVTSVDLTAGQLAGDRTAADHYGYEINTVRGDMRDLSMLDEASFDLVYQGPSMGWVPDAREVYGEVARVLRPGGRYRVDFSDPASAFVEWDGQAYRVTQPYGTRTFHPERGPYDYVHYFEDIFNGLKGAGLRFDFLEERPYCRPEPDAEPGSWTHLAAHYFGVFALVAQKER